VAGGRRKSTDICIRPFLIEGGVRVRARASLPPPVVLRDHLMQAENVLCAGTFRECESAKPPRALAVRWRPAPAFASPKPFATAWPKRLPSSTSRLPRETEIERTPTEGVHIAEEKVPAKSTIARSRAEPVLLVRRF
jgi:hypothetical protein